MRQQNQLNCDMKEISTLLESSTIHGLANISKTRKYARLFWMFVVATGFVGGGFLIKSSFDSWSESPVKTTVETLPIADIELPKVTVCPPRNTFTDLNYDLMMTENKTLTDDMRDETFKYAVEVFNKDSFSHNAWAKLQEKDRSYNWYHGYTELILPYDGYNDYLSLDTYTSATSGVVTTQYYGDQFKSEKVERTIEYRVHVYPPKSIKKNKNVTLHFKVEKVSMKGLASGSKQEFYIDHKYDFVADQITYANFTPPSRSRNIILDRKVSFEDVKKQNLGVMPGFRLTWWYSGEEVSPVKKYKDEKLNKLFVRYAKV